MKISYLYNYYFSFTVIKNHKILTNKISIIIPTFNRAHTILESLESVQKQSYRNWECIIIDDGSLDNSKEIINAFIKKDKRFKLILRPNYRNKGAASCRNIGLENITGQFIQYLDSDDLMAANKFETQINRLTIEDLNTLATCRYGVMSSAIKKTKIYKGLKSFNNFTNPLDLLKTFGTNFTYLPLHNYLIPINIIKVSGKWNEELTVTDDGEYFTRIILNSSKIIFCKETYVLYRTGAGNRISTKIITPRGVHSSIQSWKLIDQTIYSKMGIKNHIYVKSAKANMYGRLQKENKELIQKYQAFLDQRWKNPSYFFSKILNRIRSIFLVSFTKE